MKTHVKSQSMNKDLIRQIKKEYHVPTHVVGHMQKVAEVCELIADIFIENGEKVDKGSLLTAAHIHDSLRIIDFRVFDPENFPSKYSDEDLKKWYELREEFKNQSHEEALKKILQKNNPKIAELIGKHGFFSIDELNTLEEKILYYADKRVDGGKIVSLENRFKTGIKRNFNKDNHNLERITKTEEKVFRLEKELEEKIPNLQELIERAS